MADDRVERERELNIRENGERAEGGEEGNVIITPRIRKALDRGEANRKRDAARFRCVVLYESSKKPAWKQSSSYNASAVQYDFSSLLRPQEPANERLSLRHS